MGRMPACGDCRDMVDLAVKPRRFPPPWTVEETGACFIVKDRAGMSLAYVYFEEDPAGERPQSCSPVMRRGPS
jgi:hypothetical protein